MKRRNYKLVFRGTEMFGAFYVEMMIRGGYDSLIYIYERPSLEMYISVQNQRKLARKGIELYANRKKVSGLLKKGRNTSYMIKKMILGFNLTNVPKKTNSELKTILEKVYSCGMKLLKIYRFTEVMYSPEIDKTIRKFVYGKIKDRNKANYVFALLLNPSKKKKIVEERNEILTSFRIPERIKNLCQSVREMGKEKLFFRSIINQGGEFLVFLLHEIARRNYLSPQQAQNCLYQEIINLLKGKGIDLDRVNQRSKYFVTLKKGDKNIFYTKEKAKKIISKVKLRIHKDIKEFSGDIASVGIAQGKVRIIPTGLIVTKKEKELLKKKMEEMKKGEVLVATTTGPEMIMACRKAGAIVAEEGGINSHAAIISREFGIPGIVNTVIATKVLKDGDLVEVDANQGLVRILKK